MNSRAPISAFVSPSRARRATSNSCVVSSPYDSTVRLRTSRAGQEELVAAALGERTLCPSTTNMS